QNYPAHPLQATGHGDLVQDPAGKWWMVCLAIRPTSQYFQTHHLGRETILTPVAWDKDGWLVVNDGNLVGLAMTADIPPLHRWDKLPPRDDFDFPTLAPVWNFIRNPRPQSYSLSDNIGHLRLYGDSNT
ncbi:MAG TPA: family 43 glycosylhydrolase, partial [Aggregatilineales bacterium]|nr:family 43 glycosylhydrolase [Aggregatilineales bacterium]